MEIKILRLQNVRTLKKLANHIILIGDRRQNAIAVPLGGCESDPIGDNRRAVGAVKYILKFYRIAVFVLGVQLRIKFIVGSSNPDGRLGVIV